MISGLTLNEVISTTGNPLKCSVVIQFSVVERGNRFLELRSVGVLWQENPRKEEEQ